MAQNAFAPRSQRRNRCTIRDPGTSGTALAVGVRCEVVVVPPQPATTTTTASKARMPGTAPSLRRDMGRSESVAKLPEWARELLERSPVARLGLVDDDGGPRVLPVIYALAHGAIVTAIDD